MVDSETLNQDAELEAIFNDALKAVVRRQPLPRVEARFYPYAGLSSTIRLRGGRVYARVSDVLASSPPEVLHALASILVGKLYRVKPSKEHERIYRQYASLPIVLDASEAARRRRGYKRITSPRGKVYDLEVIFDGLNARYFDSSLARPQLSWSRTRTRRVLGHHDHVHGAIIISRTLDSPRIPRLVVDYVMYHEMLHVAHPPRVVAGRTIYHGPQFRADERRFEGLDEALRRLDEIAAPARRRRRRPRPR
ncbi:MAG TPA: M48 family peptidase [Blastocatellia bacterium]|nr:M48 family peptidase [Blastocatellia bacterium]